MAVAKFIGAWADDTEQTVYAGPCRLRSVEVLPNEEQAAEVYVLLYDSLNPDLTNTLPNMAIRVPTADSQGAGTHGNGLTVSGGTSRKQKVVFSGYGLVFTTGLTVMLAVTVGPAAGHTVAPTTTSLVKQIRVDYTPHA